MFDRLTMSDHGLRHEPWVRALATVVLMVATLPAQATSDRRSVTRPGGFATVCAGYSSGGGYVAGDALDGAFTSRSRCSDSTFTSGGSAQTSQNYSEFGFFNDAGQARAGFGTINIISQHVGANPGGYPAAMALGGWSDTLTFDDAARAGQAGQFTFNLDLSGSLSAAGPQGFARFQVAVARSGTLVYRLNDDIAQTTFVGDTDSVSVQRTVSVVVPFVFGTPLGIDVYASVLAGSRSANDLTLDSACLAGAPPPADPAPGELTRAAAMGRISPWWRGGDGPAPTRRGPATASTRSTLRARARPAPGSAGSCETR